MLSSTGRLISIDGFDRVRIGCCLGEDALFRDRDDQPSIRGIDWKREDCSVGAEHKLGYKGCFRAGSPKMVIIQNGSLLFCGDSR